MYSDYSYAVSKIIFIITRFMSNFQLNNKLFEHSVCVYILQWLGWYYGTIVSAYLFSN